MKHLREIAEVLSGTYLHETNKLARIVLAILVEAGLDLKVNDWGYIVYKKGKKK